MRALALAAALALQLASAAAAHAFARHPLSSFQVRSAAQDGDRLSLLVAPTASGASSRSSVSGAAIALGEAEIGCYRLYHAANLAACLKSCDGSTVAPLAAEPDYESAWAESQGARFDGSVSRSESSGTLLLRERGGRAGAWDVVPASEQASNPASALCLAAFDGDACLAEAAARLFPDDPVANDPLLAYSTLVTELNASLTEARALSGVSAVLRSKARALAESLGHLKEALERAGLAGFARTGFFVSRNLHNAPALLCQLKSRLAGTARGSAGPDSKLNAALDEDLSELDRSLDFLSRLSGS